MLQRKPLARPVLFSLNDPLGPDQWSIFELRLLRIFQLLNVGDHRDRFGELLKLHHDDGPLQVLLFFLILAPQDLDALRLLTFGALESLLKVAEALHRVFTDFYILFNQHVKLIVNFSFQVCLLKRGACRPSLILSHASAGFGSGI